MILFLYAILVFLVLRFSVTLFNFLSNPKLGLSLRHYTDLITVCIHVRDASSLPAIQSLLEQDYQQIEILIELSGDPILDDPLSASYAHYPAIQFLKPGTDPVQQAKGQYLLFLKGEVSMQNGSLHSMLHRMRVFRLSLISIIPTQLSTGIRSDCVLPLYYFILLGLVPLRLIRLSGSSLFAAGSSECMLLDRNVYTNGQWLNGLVPADLGGMEMIKVVKDHHLKAETLLGGRLVEIYSHGSPEHIFRHNGQRLFGLLGNNILAILLYLLLVIAGPVAMFMSLEINLLILPAGLIFLSRIMQSFLAGQSAWKNLILHPLQMLLLSFSLIYTATGRLLRSQPK